ncbi:MAG: tRNA 2-thiouridine(34) synthase MnmA [Sarcina sp.]
MKILKYEHKKEVVINLNKKVVLGMSGGVDSSVAAYLLKEQGYDVIGVTMQIWQEDKEYEEREGGCCSLSAVEDARRVANKLGIPFYVLNFRESFKKNVIDYFVEEYINGRTPNPCIACNKHLKFDELLMKAHGLGADYVATGHYAKIEKVNDRYVLVNADDDKKDQTYALYNMTQYQLEHTLMPCGEYKKERIREIAKEIGLAVHNKKDSEEICFIPDNNHGLYIQTAKPKKVKEGNFVDKEGNILGRHKGIVYYTIGQRKGLGLSLGRPAYVTGINPEKNEVIIGPESDIFKKELICKDINFMAIEDLKEPLEVQAKIRYSAKPEKAIITKVGEDRVKVSFETPQRAITKGQSVVFYNDGHVVGGGIIESLFES